MHHALLFSLFSKHSATVLACIMPCHFPSFCKAHCHFQQPLFWPALALFSMCITIHCIVVFSCTLSAPSFPSSLCSAILSKLTVQFHSFQAHCAVPFFPNHPKH
ncbi:hypothetical protein BX667DRAFT_504421 [Coemansia mojavensis]|nr:hypothetical protein BX667DRAFT_504546 [Coemansia mojavensis]KAI9466504.1 hypothetical protein BX667DRAFT_504404 [Coemansia mojavensis]KAI9466506.1 hypothetical protein BX667DRAFT_504421 [Coemansia mojavensis]